MVVMSIVRSLTSACRIDSSMVGPSKRLRGAAQNFVLDRFSTTSVDGLDGRAYRHLRQVDAHPSGQEDAGYSPKLRSAKQ
jgi:hypothetical protein